MNEIELEADSYKSTQGFINIKGRNSTWSSVRGTISGDISLEDAKNGLKMGFIVGATSDSAKKYWYNQFQKEKILYSIEQLKDHIEHPTKPGYKRHDILDKIKELEKELKTLE